MTKAGIICTSSELKKDKSESRIIKKNECFGAEFMTTINV